MSGLGVLLVVLWPKVDGAPIKLDRHSVVLTLPNGEQLHPLEPDEIVAWAAVVGVQNRRDVFGSYRPEVMAEIEAGVFTILRERPRAVDFVFRFPATAKPGKFTVDYIVETADGQKVPVQTVVPLVMSD
jgi:hypothetical protein